MNDNGLVMCRKGGVCACGQHKVNTGQMYTCEGIFDPGLLIRIFHSCDLDNCDGLMCAIQGLDHMFCWRRFSPLGDPDEEIKDTDEPSDAKRVEDDCYDLPVQTPVKEPENV